MAPPRTVRHGAWLVLARGPPDAEPDGPIDPDAPADADADADADAAADGEADADGEAAIDGLGDGLGETSTMTDGTGVGVGRRPTGSGPTKTNAASTPAATSTPARRPARIVAADLMRRQGTSTDVRQARSEARC